METTWKVQSEGGDFPIRQQYLECLEKIEATLLKARKSIPEENKTNSLEYDYALPTIIFAEVSQDSEGNYVEMTCYADRKAFRRALRHENQQTTEEDFDSQEGENQNESE
jgi:hypothetical protein